mmetsp:Transcript_98752/g.171106  ORF Transcript_98752/g.171106 Transcript_98752/m.171106 type:complete len:140 (+) Transcript_98752:82-501(+)
MMAFMLWRLIGHLAVLSLASAGCSPVSVFTGRRLSASGCGWGKFFLLLCFVLPAAACFLGFGYYKMRQFTKKRGSAEWNTDPQVDAQPPCNSTSAGEKSDESVNVEPEVASQASTKSPDELQATSDRVSEDSPGEISTV